MKYPMRCFQTDSQALSTLGALTAIIDNTKIDAARLQGCIPRKFGFQSTFAGKTATEGPVLVGLSNGLTIGEIAEWIAADPQRFDDPGASEQSQRPAMILDVLGKSETTVVGSTHPPWRFYKWPGWNIKEGQALNVFFFNADGSGLTTGTIVDWALQVLGDWIDD